MAFGTHQLYASKCTFLTHFINPFSNAVSDILANNNGARTYFVFLFKSEVVKYLAIDIFLRLILIQSMHHYATTNT